MEQPHGDWVVVDSCVVRVIGYLAQFVEQRSDELGTFPAKRWSVKLSALSRRTIDAVDSN